MEGHIDEESLVTEAERNNATSQSMSASPGAEEAISPAHAHANVDSMTAMQPNVRAYQGPSSASALKIATDLAGAENHIFQMKQNSYNEYRKEWSAAAAVAPVTVPTNMQLRGLSGWHPSHPSMFPTTVYSTYTVVTLAAFGWSCTVYPQATPETLHKQEITDIISTSTPSIRRSERKRSHQTHCVVEKAGTRFNFHLKIVQVQWH